MEKPALENGQKPDLVDIREVQIDRKLPQKERIRSFIQQVKDPYHFRVGDVTVSVSYAGADVSLDDRFVEMLSLLE